MPLRSRHKPFRATPPASQSDQFGTPDPAVVGPVPQSEWPEATDAIWAVVGLTRTQVAALDDALQGFVIFPGLPNYAQARSGQDDWPVPRLIAYCANRKDVGDALAFGKQQDWPISIRSGGHNTAGYHLCNGLVIDLSHMVGVTADATTQQVIAEAGATFDHMDAVLASHPFFVPGGTCGDVCCAGYYLGGGYSLASRTLGMGCDSVLSMRVMLPDGSVTEVGPDEQPDGAPSLYWAMLGGAGGQFGIVLDYTLQAHGPDRFWGFVAEWDLNVASTVLGWLEKYAMAAEQTASPFGYLTVLANLVEGDAVKNHGTGKVAAAPTCSVLGMYHGTRDDARQALAPLFSIGSPTFRYDVDGAPYRQINSEVFMFLPYVALDLMDAPSLSASGLTSPDVAVPWDALVAQAATTPNPGNLIAIEPYGGAIAAGGPHANSYPHRTQKCDIMIDSFWKPDWSYNQTRASAQAWLGETQNCIAAALSGHVYANYADRNLKDYREQYWASSFPALLAMRTKTDPNGVFDFDQSIRWTPGLAGSPPPTPQG
jgi:FAD binding domain/Berberine and berberine like